MLLVTNGLAFIYANRPYYEPERILCMAQYLFTVQTKNRLKQKGLLERFSIDCYGNEEHTKEKIRAEKTKKYKQLNKKRGSKEWDYYFLNYKPGMNDKKPIKKQTKKSRRGKSKRKTRKRRRRRKKRGLFNL